MLWDFDIGKKEKTYEQNNEKLDNHDDFGGQCARNEHSITVNRWSHGYAHWGPALFDPDMYEMAVKGRQPFGRITVANADSDANAYIHVAINQAWRAVKELG